MGPLLSAMEAIYTVPLATLVEALNCRLREPEVEDEEDTLPEYDEARPRRRRRRNPHGQRTGMETAFALQLDDQAPNNARNAATSQEK